MKDIETVIYNNLTEHLKEIDDYYDKMKLLVFSHGSIHDYRESIRRFRALLFFYKPYIKASEYTELERGTKTVFNETSLIRQIDVFEENYGHLMSESSKDKLNSAKMPLKEEMSRKLSRLDGLGIEVRSLPQLDSADYKEWERLRQMELFELFVTKKSEESDNLEKYIHGKRMIAKKLRYVHNLLMPENRELDKLNGLLDAFQIVAKGLHDSCVNLRFIGQYEMDDPELINKLIYDHEKYLRESDYLFERVRESFEGYLVF